MTMFSMQRVTVRVGRATLLRDVSLDLEPGRVTGIIGPNGAGKSTLVAVAAGHRAPTDGHVLIDGRPAARLSVAGLARRRATMTQDTQVAFPFSVGEVVAMGRAAWAGRHTDDRAIVAEALDVTGLTGLALRSVTTLSGGERQLVAFARVIAQAMPIGEDSVILLDEPTSAMDIARTETVLTTIRGLADAGATVGVVLHDLDSAAAYADRLVLMEHGRVRAAGIVDEVCSGDVLSAVYGAAIEVYTHAGRLRIGPLRTPARQPRRLE